MGIKTGQLTHEGCLLRAFTSSKVDRCYRIFSRILQWAHLHSGEVVCTTEVNTCFDSDFSGHRITDPTLGKVYSILCSDFTDPRAVVYNSKSLPPANHAVNARVANTEAVQIPCLSFLLYINVFHFIQFYVIICFNPSN